MNCCNIIKGYILSACIMCSAYAVQAQSLTSAPVSINAEGMEKDSFPVTDISSKAITGLQKQYSSLQERLNKQSAKLLSRMQAKENKLHRKLQNTDTTKAKEVFTDDVQQRYTALKNKLSDTTVLLKRFPLKEYVPGLDSMQTGLSFLLKNKNLPTDKIQQLQALSTKLKGLEGALQKANDIQSFVREREAELKEQLLNSGFAKQLTGINKQVYYYQATIAQYKELLNDKEKLKEKILETVRSLPAFQKFWQKNSYLASLFPASSGNINTAQTVTGLQSRARVQSFIAGRIGLPATNGNNNITGSTAGSGASALNSQQFVQQQMEEAQGQVNNMKDKLNKFGIDQGGDDVTTPDFKPNDQKTKSFLQRLEYGINVQSEPSRYYLPTTSDFALTLGYKLSDNKRVGLGASYKMGWGSSFKDIQLSSQGVGLRSYIDIKAKGSIWLSGGFEYNYLSAFKGLWDLENNINVWQQSALLGLSKKYKIGRKKEGNMQVLYDFLHSRENPPSQAIKFRIGYTF